MMAGRLLFGTMASACAVLAVIASLADRRRMRRGDLDQVGWMPWPLILILSLIGSAIFAGLAAMAG